MLGLPVWLWVIVVIVGVPVIALWLFISRFRKMCRAVRGEIGTYLTQKYPEMEVIGERQGNLVVRKKDGAETVWEMADVYTAVARLPGMGRDPQTRVRVYEEFVKRLMYRGPDRSLPLALATHGEWIKLQLVSREFFQKASPPSGAPCTPIPGLEGLLAVYLLDLPDGLCYLSESDRGLLGVDVPELHRLALEHLRRDFPRQIVADVAAGGNPSAIQFQDAFNAARLLLVPEFLEGDGEVIALIPHRDMLILLPASMRHDPDKLNQSLQTLKCDDHPPLFDRPVCVTRNGFELI
jgi:hypothetical protein